MTGPAKGERTPLLHTLQARQRILAGLSWDAREDEVGFFGKVIKKDSQHDLDITCIILDPDGNYVDFVGAEAQDSMDETGKIYHSGDDMTGEGDTDDEFIYAELAELPRSIAHIFFLAEVRSQHTFEDVDAPNMRLADGMNDNNLLTAELAPGESKGKTAFLFAHIYRSAKSETGWMLHNISEYPDTDQIEDWPSYLKNHL